MNRSAARIGAALAATCLSGAGAAATAEQGACAPGAGPPLTVHVHGLRDDTGRLKLELYPANERDFLRNGSELLREGKTFRRVWSSTPRGADASLCIAAPSPGRYALVLVHARDNKNKFNLWSDGVGVVGSERLGRSKPKLAQALVDVRPQGATVQVRAQYMQGLGGFGPVKR